MKILDIIYWTTIVILWVIIISSYISKRKLLKKVKKDNDDFIIECKDRTDDFFTGWSERLNLLSKENSKLREENESLKERLRNIGITDFYVI